VEEDYAPAYASQGLQLIQPTIEYLNVPSGFHDASALDELKESSRLFSGLVISVGVTQSDPQVAEELAQTITAYVRTLLRESDFACRTGDDEYLLICPNLGGVAAQRHLSALSERLWDFQLRALGSFLMLFSLGGVDVQREQIGDAIASATERMSQTKRSRKAIVMLTPGQRRRKAV
jgi:GGDEF domain-containing protein